jgi:hypothetical protein
MPALAEMTIDTFTEYTEAEPAPDDPVLAQHARATLEQWLQDHPQVTGELRETVRAHIHLQELHRCTREAQDARRNAEYDATMLARLDPGGHRVLGFVPGMALIAVLAVLDAIPLNWAAQALGLNSDGTWMVTFILAIASVGAMLAFELTRGHPRRRWRLWAVVTAGFAALLALRTEYLTTVAGYSFPAALLQAAMLTGLSAGFTLCGSAVLARTRSLSLSRARSSARRARQATIKASATQRLASEKLQLHIGVLRQMFLPWALGSAPPVDVDRAKWAAALERAVQRILLAAPVGVDRAKWAAALERAVHQLLAS